jgi:hypothetical protein
MRTCYFRNRPWHSGMAGREAASEFSLPRRHGVAVAAELQPKPRQATATGPLGRKAHQGAVDKPRLLLPLAFRLRRIWLLAGV